MTTTRLHKFRPWQKALVRKILARKYSLVVGARQIGKSYLLAWLAMMLASDGERVIVLSMNEAKAKNYIQEIRRMVREIKSMAPDWPDYDHRDASAFEVRHTSGGSIRAVPGTPESLQSYSGHVLVDELGANAADTNEIFEQAMAVTSAREDLKLVMISNATEPGTWLDLAMNSPAERWQEIREIFEPEVITIYDAYPNPTPKQSAMISRMRKTYSSDGFARWYLCQFVGHGGALISGDDLRGMLELPARDSLRVRVMGVDIGTSRDPTSMVVLGKHVLDESWHVLAARSEWGMPLSRQPDWIREQIRIHGVTSCALDRGGIGIGIAQSMTRDRVITPVNYTAPFYKRCCEITRASVAQGLLHIDPQFEMLRQQVVAMTISESGTPRKPYEHLTRGGVPVRTHCDEADALLGAISLTTTAIPDTLFDYSSDPDSALDLGLGSGGAGVMDLVF